MNAVQKLVETYYQEALSKPNNEETRAELNRKINRLFVKLDEQGIARPNDYNIAINQDNGKLEVFFAKEYTNA